MGKAPDQGWRRARLDALAQHEEFAGRAALGRALGYKDGAFIRQMIQGERPITEKTIHAVDSLRGGRFRGWFDKPSSGGEVSLSIAESAPSYQTSSPPGTEQLLGMLDRAEVQQLLRDLDDLTPARQSALIDMVHQEAEQARDQAEHLVRKRQTTMAARKSGGSKRSKLTLKLGDGNPDQGSLELQMVDDPFKAEPDDRELELYQRIAKDRLRKT